MLIVAHSFLRQDFGQTIWGFLPTMFLSAAGCEGMGSGLMTLGASVSDWAETGVLIMVNAGPLAQLTSALLPALRDLKAVLWCYLLPATYADLKLMSHYKNDKVFFVDNFAKLFSSKWHSIFFSVYCKSELHTTVKLFPMRRLREWRKMLRCFGIVSCLCVILELG